MKSKLVKEGYNKVADKYSSQRGQFTNNKYLEQLVKLLKPGSVILDIGCGAGEYQGLEENFHGTKMWWSHYGHEKNSGIVENAGFKILLDEIDTGGDEKHQVVLGRKM